MNGIVNICLTGGPCSGKTSTLELLSTIESINGYGVLLVPEAATLLGNGGLPHKDNYDSWQESIFDLQISLNNIYQNYADNLNANMVIIHDRGLHDTLSFCSEELSKYLLAKHEIEDPYNFYDYIIHLTSLAQDKPYLYGNSNNKIRKENLQEAIIAEENNLEFSKKCENLIVIDNEGTNSFEDKFDKIMSTIEDILDRESQLLM